MFAGIGDACSPARPGHPFGGWRLLRSDSIMLRCPPMASSGSASDPCPLYARRRIFPRSTAMDQTATVDLGTLSIRYLVDGTPTHSMGMFELTVMPGAHVPPPHSHSNNEEILYVTEGMLRYTVGDETRDLRPGESMHTPKGVVHAFSNPFSDAARALVILSPDIGSQYFVDVAE